MGLGQGVILSLGKGGGRGESCYTKSPGEGRVRFLVVGQTGLGRDCRIWMQQSGLNRGMAVILAKAALVMDGVLIKECHTINARATRQTVWPSPRMIKRIPVVRYLVEGSNLRSTARMTGVSKNTVTKLLVDLGLVCAEYRDKHLRNLFRIRVQFVEIWS